MYSKAVCHYRGLCLAVKPRPVLGRIWNRFMWRNVENSSWSHGLVSQTRLNSLLFMMLDSRVLALAILTCWSGFNRNPQTIPAFLQPCVMAGGKKDHTSFIWIHYVGAELRPVNTEKLREKSTVLWLWKIGLPLFLLVFQLSGCFYSRI